MGTSRFSCFLLLFLQEIAIKRLTTNLAVKTACLEGSIGTTHVLFMAVGL